MTDPAPPYTGPNPGGIAERALKERDRQRWHEWNDGYDSEPIDELPDHSRPTKKETDT